MLSCRGSPEVNGPGLIGWLPDFQEAVSLSNFSAVFNAFMSGHSYNFSLQNSKEKDYAKTNKQSKQTNNQKGPYPLNMLAYISPAKPVIHDCLLQGRTENVVLSFA